MSCSYVIKHKLVWSVTAESPSMLCEENLHQDHHHATEMHVYQCRCYLRRQVGFDLLLLYVLLTHATATMFARLLHRTFTNA